MTIPDTASARSVEHATFVIERTFDFPVARVFRSWADPATKAAWFVGPDDSQTSDHELEFRVGGREHVSGEIPGAGSYAFDARYQDIVPEQRIVYSYDMHLDGRRISVSVATIEFLPAEAGTLLIVTEQGAFLDGLDNAAERDRGTRELLDQLDAALRRESTSDAAIAKGGLS
jgi:uncharacterized protein YndB with AHSA1/START domain